MTLDELRDVVGPPPAALSEALLGRLQPARLLGLGTRFDSQDILADVPRFVAHTRAIYASLSGEQRDLIVGYAPSIDALLVAESLALRDLKAKRDASGMAGSGTGARREAHLRARFRAGVALRDQAVRSLRRVAATENESLAELEASIGTAKSPEHLAFGLESIAEQLRAHIASGDAGSVALMRELGLTEAYAARLVHAAAVARTAGAAHSGASAERRVSQRALDIQDGVVLFLIDLTYRAFKDASAQDETILIPRLYGVARLVQSKPRARKNGAAPAESSLPA